MVIDGTMQEYLDEIDGVAERQLESYTERLAESFPLNIAEDIAREMLIYG
jgi:hypothetical protein